MIRKEIERIYDQILAEDVLISAQVKEETGELAYFADREKELYIDLAKGILKYGDFTTYLYQDEITYLLNAMLLVGLFTIDFEF